MTFQILGYTTRDREYKSSVSLKDISLNGGYDSKFFTENQFKDYKEANIVISFKPIPNDKYDYEIPVIDENENPTGEMLPNLTRLMLVRYSDKWADGEILRGSLIKSNSDTEAVLFDTHEDIIIWIRERCSCYANVTDGRFLISETIVTDDIEGTTVTDEERKFYEIVETINNEGQTVIQKYLNLN